MFNQPLQVGPGESAPEFGADHTCFRIKPGDRFFGFSTLQRIWHVAPRVSENGQIEELNSLTVKSLRCQRDLDL